LDKILSALGGIPLHPWIFIFETRREIISLGRFSVFSENHQVWALEDFMRPLGSFFQKLLFFNGLRECYKKFLKIISHGFQSVNSQAFHTSWFSKAVLT
jgi:hypothetical protein